MDPSYLPAVVALLGGGGLGATIVALMRVRPDVARVTVSAAEGAVIVQSGVISTLREEIKRLQVEADCYKRDCEKKFDEYTREIRALKKALRTINERRGERRDEETP